VPPTDRAYRLAVLLPTAGAFGGARALRGASGSYLGALTLTAQLLETRVDRRKIIGSSGTSPLATKFLDASADHRKIVSGTGSGHIFSPFR
jgi:hypothetical protein